MNDYIFFLDGYRKILAECELVDDEAAEQCALQLSDTQHGNDVIACRIITKAATFHFNRDKLDKAAQS